jgi:hypothetical protein
VSVTEQFERYLAEVGRQPREAPPEYAWQWRYRGLPSERELLAELLQDEEVVLGEQQSLFEDDLRFIDQGS